MPPLPNTNNDESSIGFFLLSKCKKDLANALEEPYRRFTYLLFSLDRDSQYVTYNISKGYKGQRTIEAPISALKNIQRKLDKIIRKIYTPPQSVHAYINGKNIVSNARKHIGKKYIFKFDLKDFYGTINFGRVRGLFLAVPFEFNTDVATTLAQICCVHNHLPQGAPTSPIISNMICLKMDFELNRFAKNNHLEYTRYADDITLSTNTIARFKNEKDYIEHVKNHLSGIVAKNGFHINNSKTKILKNKETKYVTGIKVNTKVNVSRGRIRSIRAMLFSLETKGPEESLRAHLERWRRRNTLGVPKDFIQIILGKLAFLKAVRGEEDLIYLKLKSRLYEWITLRSTTAISFHDINKIASLDTSLQAVIFTEGPSDRIHFMKALSVLKKKKMYCDLNIIFHCFSPASISGDTALKNILLYSTLQEIHNGKLKIVISDSDSEALSKKITGQYDNNIFYIKLPTPKHRDGCDSLSIEHYYSDNLLALRDSDGRRLYQVSEFDRETGNHIAENDIKCDKRVLGTKAENTIIDSGVTDSNGKSLALKKIAFAKNIATGEFPSTDDDFFAYIPIFDQIYSLIKKYSFVIKR